MKVIRAVLTVETTDQRLAEVSLNFGEEPDFEWSESWGFRLPTKDVLAFVKCVRRAIASLAE